MMNNLVKRVTDYADAGAAKIGVDLRTIVTVLVAIALWILVGWPLALLFLAWMLYHKYINIPPALRSFIAGIIDSIRVPQPLRAFFAGVKDLVARSLLTYAWRLGTRYEKLEQKAIKAGRDYSEMLMLCSMVAWVVVDIIVTVFGGFWAGLFFGIATGSTVICGDVMLSGWSRAMYSLRDTSIAFAFPTVIALVIGLGEHWLFGSAGALALRLVSVPYILVAVGAGFVVVTALVKELREAFTTKLGYKVIFDDGCLIIGKAPSDLVETSTKSS